MRWDFVQVILRGQYGRLASVDQHGRGLPGLVFSTVVRRKTPLRWRQLLGGVRPPEDALRVPVRDAVLLDRDGRVEVPEK